MKFIIYIVILYVIFNVHNTIASRYISRTTISEDWSILQEITNKTTKDITFKLALYPKDSQLLEKQLLEISTPGSKSFRKYLSKSEITLIVGREKSELDKITNWLASHGVKVISIHPNKDWITASSSISIIEKMFECHIIKYVNSKTKQEKIGSKNGYTIPFEMENLIELIAGMNTFPSSRWDSIATNVRVQDDAVVTAEITPQTIYDVYQVDKSGSKGYKKGSQAVVEFGQLANFNTKDLQNFFSDFQPALKGEECTMAAGENNGNVKASVEANLDVQYIMATGVYINTTDYKLATTHSEDGIEDDFLSYTQMVNAQYEPPLVHSISYGEYGGTYDNATDQRFSYELQKMGIAGISVLLASGDNGVGCDSTGLSQEYAYPSSPYITMVGATYIDKNTNTEVGATLSSGGFSKDFYQASWQASAVEGYFTSGVALPNEYYERNGRAYPDIAAFGQNVLVNAGGATKPVSGTSCSAPIFAGVVALINDKLISSGKAPLGFLNPWLYAYPEMFTDITEGSNPYGKCAGFTATKGWDPVTGLGTPLYPEMLANAFNALNKK